mmetsp:Transcript_25650/g.33481  ORF Transcript_25650/g.33481 Transcript_25650/m.33481 type:complete len:398 (+) Transcript_25650:336-1529(+)
MSQGEDIFEDMFDNVEGQKILQWKYHRTNKRLVLGEHITRECLEKVHKRSPRLLSGRNMLDKRKTVVPLVRKAFSFLKKYIDMTTGALLPGHSGWDAEDVENAVRKDMYYELVVRKKLVDNDDDEDNVDVKVVDHNNNKGKTVESEEVQKEDIDNNGNDDGTDGYKVPEDFVWAGMMLFLFVAPFEANIKAGRVATNFQWDAPSKKLIKSGKLGRNAIKKRKAEEDAFSRSVDDNRGSRMSTSDQLHADTLKLNENNLKLSLCSLQMEKNKQRSQANEAMLFNLTQQISSLHQQVQEVFEMIKHKMPGVSHNDVQELWKKIHSKREEMENITQATVDTTNDIEMPNLDNTVPINECDLSTSIAAGRPVAPSPLTVTTEKSTPQSKSTISSSSSTSNN